LITGVNLNAGNGHWSPDITIAPEEKIAIHGPGPKPQAIVAMTTS
jgi:hypothetical protein